MRRRSGPAALVHKVAVLARGNEPVLLLYIPAKVHLKATRGLFASQSQAPRLAAVAFRLRILLPTHKETLFLTSGLHILAKNILRFFGGVDEIAVKALVKHDAPILMKETNTRREHAPAADVSVAIAASNVVERVLGLAGHQVHQRLLWVLRLSLAANDGGRPQQLNSSRSGRLSGSFSLRLLLFLFLHNSFHSSRTHRRRKNTLDLCFPNR